MLYDRNSHGNDSLGGPFAHAPAIVTFICMECLVIVQGLLARQDHFLTVSQMRQRGIEQGLPFVWHFAMWGDILIVSGLAAYLIGRHSFSWHGSRVLASFAIGLALAIFLGWTYTFSKIPEAHIQNHQLTIAGVVHIFYMAIALAVFIQFFLFTKNVSVRLLTVTSLLLFIHVFFGTHMALGILKAIHPLSWYPVQPLKSLFGWITIATVAFGLVWRNVGTSAIVAAPKNAARSVFTAGKWLLHISPESEEGYLKALDNLCGSIGFLSFGSLVFSRWHRHAPPLTIVLTLLLGTIYYLSRLSALQELEIARSLFPLDRFPDELQFKDRAKVASQVTLFLVLYLFEGYIADDIMMASICMLVISCIDLNTRWQINKKVHLYFSSARYSPAPDEKDYDAMQKRRGAISWFLFKLPHLRKEAGRAAGCAAASGIAIYENFNNDAKLNILAYSILIGTLVLNEIITLTWRILRDRRLKLL
jgi:hypothetical protein